MSSQDTHWCHTCNRAIKPYPSDMICPHCYGGFIQELNELGGGRDIAVYVAGTGMDAHSNHAMHDAGGAHNMLHGHGMGGMGMEHHGNHAMHDMGGAHNMFHDHGMDLQGIHAMHGMGGAHNMFHNHGTGGMGMDHHGHHAMHDMGGGHNMFHDHGIGHHGNHAMHDMGGGHNMFHDHGMGHHGNHAMHGMGGAHDMFHNHGMEGMGMDHHGNHNMFHNHGMGGMGMDHHGNHAMHDMGGAHDHGMGMQFPPHGRGHFLTDEVDDIGVMNHGLNFMDATGEPDRPAGPVRRGDTDSLKTVTITRRHVDDDSNCTICMEKFELNSQVKETPCEHLYHEDCILPWLRQHGTCPVCRHDLSSNGARGGSNGGGNAANGSNNRGRNGRRDDENRGPNPFPLIITTGLSLVILIVANLRSFGRPF